MLTFFLIDLIMIFTSQGGKFFMIVDITDIKKQSGLKKQFSVNEDFLVSEPNAELTVKAKADLVLTNTGKSILLTGSLSGETSVECARCLKLHPVSFTSAVYEDFHCVSEMTSQSRYDLDFFEYSGSRVDISEALRQNCIINIPFTHLCSPDCKGLCGSCGCDLNTGECSCSEQEHIS